MATLAGKRPTVAPTYSTAGDRYGVVPNHAYAVIGFRTGVQLRNPWGGTGANLTISVPDFQKAFQGLWQAV
jgi:hypothetical protein